MRCSHIAIDKANLVIAVVAHARAPWGEWPGCRHYERLAARAIGRCASTEETHSEIEKNNFFLRSINNFSGIFERYISDSSSAFPKCHLYGEQLAKTPNFFLCMALPK